MSGRKDRRGPQGRTEPTLGNLDDLHRPAEAPAPVDDLPSVSIEPPRRRGAEPAARPAPPRAPVEPVERRRGWLLPVALLVLVGIVTVLWLNQDTLRALVPRTDFNDVLARANAALDDGRLDGSDGTSARELFQAARALEPDNDRALAGLRDVGQAELAQAQKQLAAGQLDEAARSAAAARELLGGGSEVDRVDRAIGQARAAHVHADDLVQRARDAFAQGRLDGDDGAGALYARVLSADPDNAVAAHGLDQVGGAYANQARKALDQGDAKSAGATIDKLASLLPRYGDLPSLRAAQAQAQRQHDDDLNQALGQGMEALRAGRITGDGDDTALAYFKQALALDPDNADARGGIGKVVQALIVQANAMIDGGDTAQATRLLDQAQALAPKSADLAAARARLQGAPSSDAGNAPPPDAAPAGNATDDDSSANASLSPGQSAQVAQLVQQARAAAKRGDIMLPPGQSAYDLYRSALAIDGNNGPARAGLQGLPGQVTGAFNRALGDGNLGKAGDMLGNLSDLAPGDPALATLRQRLGNAWLDRAEQQLDSGDRAGAAQSLDRVRSIAPQQPRLQELSIRLAGGR